MSGCEVWRLPQQDRDRWDAWALCEAIGGCGQDECTFYDETEEPWPRTGPEPARPSAGAWAEPPALGF